MKALVTGGGGFLGGAVVRMLVARGDAVRSFSRGDYSQLTALGVESIRGDLGDADALLAAAEGCDIIFHIGARPGVWGPPNEYDRANIAGTENVLRACERHSIRRLVFTGSPSGVFAGEDQNGVDESVPYPAKYMADYPRTKAASERLVLAANSDNLATVSLRPHLIWGPGDTHLIPRIIRLAKAGRLRVVGYKPNLVDSTYVDNAAEAHLLAADRLAKGSPIGGKAYFVTNGEPIPMAELINRILDAAGLPAVESRVPVSVAFAAGAVLEAAYSLLGIEDREPPMTRFVAKQLGTAHWFDITAARAELGYVPRVSIAEGLERLRQSFQRRGDARVV